MVLSYCVVFVMCELTKYQMPCCVRELCVVLSCLIYIMGELAVSITFSCIVFMQYDYCHQIPCCVSGLGVSGTFSCNIYDMIIDQCHQMCY